MTAQHTQNTHTHTGSQKRTSTHVDTNPVFHTSCWCTFISGARLSYCGNRWIGVKTKPQHISEIWLYVWLLLILKYKHNLVSWYFTTIVVNFGPITFKFLLKSHDRAAASVAEPQWPGSMWREIRMMASMALHGSDGPKWIYGHTQHLKWTPT